MTRITRRQALASAGALAATGLPLAAQASAENAAANFPSKPIRIIVPYQAGGATDALSRLLGQHIGPDLGQPVVVDNKPGAGGILGTNEVAKSDPDGHTISLGLTSTLLVNRFLYSKMPFDPARDLDMLYRPIDSGTLIAVHSGVPVKTLGELFKHIEANRGKLSYGSYGLGSYPHLAGERINQMTKGEMTHAPYKGEAPMVQALLARDIDVGWGSVQVMKQFVDAGKLRVLAITGRERPPGMPDVPTFTEAGVNDDAFNIVGFFGMAVAAKTPDAIKQKLSNAIAKALSKPEVNARVAAMGFRANTNSSPQEFTALYKRELPKWEALVKSVGVKLD
ncbi:Bug family tripartite tricarboxylate transporter substrate binding protein [Comamonas serinivorans]|nr:tripartite tricarboxylate transporter substrate binding protein [Comamonas serinivorans]